MKIPRFDGLRVTVMGLGLHGGGAATVRFLANAGAAVTVTDLRTGKDLKASIDQLGDVDARYVLGTHEPADFRDADIVIKNPAVRRTVPILQEASFVSTDIALFLAVRNWNRQQSDERAIHHGIGGRGDRRTHNVGRPPDSAGHPPDTAGRPTAGTERPGPLIAVTGTKGKSTTAAATAHLLQSKWPGARLGGNITVSPLRFVSQTEPTDPIVLELSSFQLGDLAWCRRVNATPGNLWMQDDPFFRHLVAPTVRPDVAVVTNLLWDHQDYYGSMELYARDKQELLTDQGPLQHAILSWDHPATRRMAAVAQAHLSWVTETAETTGGSCVAYAGTGQLETGDGRQTLLPDVLPLTGSHNRLNLMFAATAAYRSGMNAADIRNRISSFQGVPHRMETVAITGNVTIVNDSAATIPEAMLAAVRSLSAPVILIAGGTDKKLRFEAFVQAVKQVDQVFLLKGSATDAVLARLQSLPVPVHGPYDSLGVALTEAVATAEAAASNVDRATVILSPGCASFGMFRNEFDRGDQFRELARRLKPAERRQ